MPLAYRIFKTKHASKWYDGEGARLFGGRWNSPGTRLLYASESLSLATLEMLVHLENESLLASYSFATLELSDKDILPVEKFGDLPANWYVYPAPADNQRIGDMWAASLRSLALRVPSAVSKGEYNYLINVEHPEFRNVKRGRPQRFRFDVRLRGRG